MHHLQRAGYYTALIGKHHYIDRYGLGVDVTDDDDEIRRYGFDHVWQVVDAGENQHNDDRYTAYLRSKGVLEAYRQQMGRYGGQCKNYPFAEEECEDGYIAAQGCDFVASYDREEPFYLNLSFVGPHPPYWHPGDLQHDPAAMRPPLNAPDDPWTRERRAHYMDKCAIIDRAIGRLLQTLEEKGLRQRTAILFVSDHGDNLGDFGIWDKRYFYEQSAGVPSIMCGPHIGRGARGLTGKVSRMLVSLLDLYPTILGLAGIDVAPLLRQRDGRDLVAALASEREAVRSHVVAELGTAVMIRTGNWKLVYDPEQGGVQALFNLVNDPQELNNLAGVAGYEATASHLIEALLAHRIRLTQFTHDKEERRLQRVRVAY
jgi:choline-sulfatase